jgi:hypothetical protein
MIVNEQFALHPFLTDSSICVSSVLLLIVLLVTNRLHMWVDHVPLLNGLLHNSHRNTCDTASEDMSSVKFVQRA